MGRSRGRTSPRTGKITTSFGGRGQKTGYGHTGASNPGTVAPRMMKLYDGRNVATRPIPVITDYGDALALRAAAADLRPKAFAVNMPSSPHPVGTGTVFGAQVAGAAKVRGGVFNPATGLGEHT